MSLDVTLIEKEGSEKICEHCDSTYHSVDQVYTANITHNLGEMAGKAGIYEALWRPYKLDKNCPKEFDDYTAELAFEEAHEYFAKDIINVLEKGLKDLKEKPDYYKQFNSENGWGLYEHFVPFVEKYLEACKENPDCLIEVSR